VKYREDGEGEEESSEIFHVKRGRESVMGAIHRRRAKKQRALRRRWMGQTLRNLCVLCSSAPLR
jgi:hypothetical protein